MERLCNGIRKYISLMSRLKMDQYSKKARTFRRKYRHHSFYLTLIQNRSVEPGTQILPPFETPVGRVGLAICFDVSYIDTKLEVHSND